MSWFKTQSSSSKFNTDHGRSQAQSQAPVAFPSSSSSYTVNQTQPIPRFSKWSTAAVPDSAWAAGNFLLGAGMVAIQPLSEKIVVVYESKREYWFLPKGRKDIGESLEEAALREAYEESGIRVEFMPLCTFTRQPFPPGGPRQHTNTEPIFVTTQTWGPRKNDPGGEYLTFYYVGQIAENAMVEPGTRMPDEVNYVTYLLPFEEAVRCLEYPQNVVVQLAWKLWKDTLRMRLKYGQDLAGLNAGARSTGEEIVAPASTATTIARNDSGVEGKSSADTLEARTADLVLVSASTQTPPQSEQANEIGTKSNREDETLAASSVESSSSLG